MSMPTIADYIFKLNRDQALNSVIASIALSEASLSHILNAEGEKTQLAAAMTDTDDPAAAARYADDPAAATRDLILMNESTKNVVSGAYRIERSLSAKLSAAIGYIRRRAAVQPPPPEAPAELHSGYVYVGINEPLTARADGGLIPRGAPVANATVAFRCIGGPMESDLPSWMIPGDATVVSLSDQNGRARFRLAEGLYDVYLLTIPENTQYIMTAKHWALRITADGYSIGGFTPDSFPGLPLVDTSVNAQTVSFAAVDSETGEPLPGGCYMFEGLLDGEHTVDSVCAQLCVKPGAAETSLRLPYGYYTISEISSPAGYTLEEAATAHIYADVQESGYEFVKGGFYQGLNRPLELNYIKSDAISRGRPD
ncbi:MAG: prealbumin-like fold domain-containing protein [Oscillospiraceae bacterium]|jgi:hypothetical protein|nr:prealbumin-like fold domain-containing protein [Oscillospiraceae bacterium]